MEPKLYQCCGGIVGAKFSVVRDARHTRRPSTQQGRDSQGKYGNLLTPSVLREDQVPSITMHQALCLTMLLQIFTKKTFTNYLLKLQMVCELL